MTSKKKLSNGVYIILIMIILAISCVLSISKSFYVDINSGRIKEEISAGHIVLFAKITETVVSKSLNIEGKHGQPQWKNVIQKSIISPVSPYYRYHSFISEVKIISFVFDSYDVSDKNRTLFSTQYLHWIRSENYSSLSQDGPYHEMINYIESKKLPADNTGSKMLNHHIERFNNLHTSISIVPEVVSALGFRKIQARFE